MITSLKIFWGIYGENLRSSHWDLVKNKIASISENQLVVRVDIEHVKKINCEKSGNYSFPWGSSLWNLVKIGIADVSENRLIVRADIGPAI